MFGNCVRGLKLGGCVCLGVIFGDLCLRISVWGGVFHWGAVFGELCLFGVVSGELCLRISEELCLFGDLYLRNCVCLGGSVLAPEPWELPRLPW